MNNNDAELIKFAGIGYFIWACTFWLGYQSGLAHRDQKAARRQQQAQRRLNKGIRRNRR